MSDYKAPLDDIRFVMHRVFKLEAFWQSLKHIAEVDAGTADAILEEAAKVCEQVIAPLSREADEQGCRWSSATVTTPEGFKAAYQTYCEGGWSALGGNPQYEGMGMPKTLTSMVEEMVQGADLAFGLCPMLTTGAAVAIDSHADESLKQTYLPHLYSGQWSGTMALTEPHCGTDLGMIRSRAVPNEDGSYKITGTKIFITWGEHDMVENIVHLVLAKLPDSPEGSRGISMFLVPKFIPDAEGNIGERNAVTCGSIEKKMGIKASATCVMNFDGAKAWLIGEPNRGLASMFTMMNYERLGVGVQGVSVAQASYQTALAYAKDRLQGRSASGAKSPDKPADSLLVHADIRRMLLTMKAWNEGSRAFYIYLAKWLDLAKHGGSVVEQARAEKLAALLTPICKAFMTDVALETTILGQQILGGHGYVREWGQEQRVRDVRITQIYEGTNGIQALDLIGRKTIATEGKYLALFVEDIMEHIENTKSTAGVEVYHEPLLASLKVLQTTTDDILKQSARDVEASGSAAVDYLEMCGLVTYAYMWSLMASAVLASGVSNDFEQAKLHTANFYYIKMLPKIHTLSARIAAGSSSLMDISEQQF